MNQRASSASFIPLLILALVAVFAVAILVYLGFNSLIDQARGGKSLGVTDVKESAKEAVFDTKSILFVGGIVLLGVVVVCGILFFLFRKS